MAYVEIPADDDPDDTILHSRDQIIPAWERFFGFELLSKFACIV
jgi:hypothetical protein